MPRHRLISLVALSLFAASPAFASPQAMATQLVRNGASQISGPGWVAYRLGKRGEYQLVMPKRGRHALLFARSGSMDDDDLAEAQPLAKVPMRGAKGLVSVSELMDRHSSYGALIIERHIQAALGALTPFTKLRARSFKVNGKRFALIMLRGKPTLIEGSTLYATNRRAALQARDGKAIAAGRSSRTGAVAAAE